MNKKSSKQAQSRSVTFYHLLKASWFIFIISLSFGFYHFLFFERIFPNIYVMNVNIGGLTPDEANNRLTQISIPKQLVFSLKRKDFSLKSKDIDVGYDIDNTISTAYEIYRNKPFYQILLSFQQLVNKKTMPLVITYNQESFYSFLKQKEAEELSLAIKPKVSVVNGKIEIDRGKIGEVIDFVKAKQNLTKALEYGDTNQIEIPITLVDQTLNQDQTDNLYQRAENLLKKQIIFTFESNEYPYQTQSVVNLIDPYEGYNNEEIDNLISNLSKIIERDPQNPVFVFENDRVKEFSPAVNGVIILKNELRKKIINGLDVLEKNNESLVIIEIPTQQTLPEYQTSQVNNLGINTLIGVGKSRFSHSIPSRIHNVALAASKFNGILIKPGESFSFNKTLGDVSSYTGYQQAYIIKDGQTILGDGGGVCQVSTTLFRALLDAGLPITERRAHAYRVSYYEEDSSPGFDATVYDPSPDLKFTNNTPGHILIQTKTDTSAKTLRFEIYGTDDGRVAVVTKPVITSVTPPPDDLYIDDPTLPSGTTKQIDWKAWGAKVSFKYTVTRNNEVLIDKTFYSNYQPWQAKYLRGTGPQF